MHELEFLRASFADAQATVRAYDTKSQIVLASTAFSFNPIFNSIKQIDTSTAVNLRIGIVFCLFVVVLLLFLRVLGPVSSKLRENEAEDVFFLNNARKYDPLSYREALQKTDLATSYAEQVLKLHAIRKTKHNRFQAAVLGLALYLFAVLLYGAAMLVTTMV
ncbi:MAG: hypothetical protein JOZ16_11725 [Methylobacteriaceae bacterium]|nr:hypothetical protein [Methylobacteriaceae bacterium]